jgi:hypothetical protein
MLVLLSGISFRAGEVAAFWWPLVFPVRCGSYRCELLRADCFPSFSEERQPSASPRRSLLLLGGCQCCFYCVLVCLEPLLLPLLPLYFCFPNLFFLGQLPPLLKLLLKFLLLFGGLL